MRSHRFTVCAICCLIAVAGCATLKDLGYGAGGSGSGLDEATVVAGLKEALSVGTGRTVEVAGKVDGYLANELIRIALPDQLAPVAATLRGAHLGAIVDELETGMNRAAELAAGGVRDIFVESIRGLTLADAMAILRGSDTAATDYFRSRTQEALAARFRPIVAARMNEVGVSRLYSQALGTYERIPLVSKPTVVDLEEHVTERALSGLFTVLGQQEQLIRRDPVARTTALLKKVFAE